MKNLILLCTICLMTLSLQAQNNNTDKTYVDLGLPSGTLWRSYNAQGYYTYDEAVSQFGKRLPTKEQWVELRVECQWHWDKDFPGWVVVGPNGNYIVLHCDKGFQVCNGSFHYSDGTVISSGYDGNYWSSTLIDDDNAWSLFLHSLDVSWQKEERCRGNSVRLVKVK